MTSTRSVREANVITPARLSPEIAQSLEPVVLRGFVRDWPLVTAARASDGALLDYLLQFDIGAIVPISVGAPADQGRIFYNKNYTGLNVDQGNSKMGELLRRVHRHGSETPSPTIYLASIDVDQCLPGLRAGNDVDFGTLNPLRSIWIGTRTRIAAHNDLPLNIACVAAGRRRFTLFPPNQTANLYPGPFELTPAGRPISMIDFAAPDYDRFPKFADAMAVAQIAELAPGDALFIPSMWWHHVEALDAFNVLINYWWRTVPTYLGTPQDVLQHAMMTLRDLPDNERVIWRDLFEHYVFTSKPDDVAHIPEHIRGVLGPMNADLTRKVRAFLLNRLNR